MYPPLPVSTDGKGEENTGIRQRLCSAKEQGERSPLQMPLRGYNSLQFRMNGALPSAPRSLVLPAIFLYRCIKLAETHSTILRGATSHN